MTPPRPKNAFLLCAVIVAFAVLLLFAGCRLDPPTIEYIYNYVSIQATVENTTSKTLSVSLLPALGSRENAAYQWTLGLDEINKNPDFSYPNPTATASLTANSKQELRTRFGQTFYDGLKIGDKILSFLLQIDGTEYAGWGVKYGDGGRTLVGQGYGYSVLYEDSNPTANWNSCPLPGREYTDSGSQFYIAVRYTITIADSGVKFVLDEVAHGVEWD
jgi:hypothetical protein